MSRIRVSVVSALPDAATEIALELPEGATVAEALARSGIGERPGAGGLSQGPVGIFGKRVGLDTVLADGDRVELYRPLAADPKQARRRRASDKQR